MRNKFKLVKYTTCNSSMLKSTLNTLIANHAFRTQFTFSKFNCLYSHMNRKKLYLKNVCYLEEKSMNYFYIPHHRSSVSIRTFEQGCNIFTFNIVSTYFLYIIFAVIRWHG